MENKIKLYEKLHKIQEAIKGLSKDKDSHNYKYVTGNKILSHIKPLMEKYKLLLKQEVVSIDNERMDYQVFDKWMLNGKFDEKGVQLKGVWKAKSEILSKVMMQFTWIDCETGEKDVNSFGSNGQNDWEKGLGSALTYAERYFLLKYFHISTDEDDIDNPYRFKEDPIIIEPEKEEHKQPVRLKELTSEGLKHVIEKGKLSDIEVALNERIITEEQRKLLTVKQAELKTA